MTTEIALLPPINRNLYQIVDHNGYGLIGYGSRCDIYVFDLRNSLPVVLDSNVVRNAHRGKIFSVSFCKYNGSQLLASVGEELILKIWDLKTITLITSLEVKECSQVVEWLYETSNLVVYPDTGGTVCKWNITTNSLVRMKTGSDRVINVMASNPKQPELLAVGHSVGTISVLNVNNQTCMTVLKAHSMEINSLSWSPVSPSTLLSTSLDQSARVWKLQDAKPVHTYYYPSTRYKVDDKKNSKICSIFHPENPDVIICSNVRGALGSVQFSENAPPKFTPYSTEDFDSFYKNVCQMLPYVDVTGENKHILMTCDLAKVALWNISDGKLLSSYYCIQGNVFHIAVSPINQNLMAVGPGDGFLKVLNIQPEEKLAVTSIYINLRMKIMSVDWHPTEENIIAYGSDEGRVGIVDFSKKRSMYSFETHHGNSVYCLQWGPCSKIADSKQVYFLYSCGGGTILIHELHKPKAKAVAFETLVNIPADLEVEHTHYSELSWKTDYSCLAVGTFKGLVYLYNDKFDLLCKLSLQLKNVENIKWHPVHTYSSYAKESKYSSWLAAVGNDENIHIFDASDVLNQQSGGFIFKPTRTLAGHKKRVSALCWSPHTDGHLLSGGRDGVIQVWNVITGTPIVNYMWHKDRVYAVQWSVLDPDIVYSGGLDNCLRVWRISEQNQSEIPTKSIVTKHKPYKRIPKFSPEEKTESGVFSSSKNETSESKTDITENEIPESPHFTQEDVKKVKQPQTRSDILNDAEGKASLFNLKRYSKEESFKNIFTLVDLLCDESLSNTENSEPVADKLSSRELLNLGFFIDQDTALKMLETKGKIEEARGNRDRAVCLQMMAGNVFKLLTDAVEKKQLTDFLVSISPSVSHKFWLNICEKYAVQLIEEQQYIKGSLYFVLCGKLYDALKILAESGRLLDTLALAKAQLPESDPFIKSMLCKVSTQCRILKQVENEAACYIALKNPLHAAKIMNCVGDAKYAYASVYICNKFNLPEATLEYAVICVEKCLSQNDWPTFYKVAEMVECVKVYKVVVRVHEIIASHIKALKKEEGAVADKLFGVNGSKILIWNGKTFENSNCSFLAHIYDVLKSEGLLSDDEEVLQSVHKALNSIETREKSEAHVSVAIYVSQVIILSLLGDLFSATKYFMKIFHCTHNVVFMPKVICWIFFPLDLYWCSNKNTFLCEIKKMETDAIPFTSHFQDIFYSVCNKFECISKSDSEICIVHPDIMAYIEVVVQQVLTLLSRKTAEDSLLLYFSSHYLNELKRLSRKGWRFRCYEKGTVSDITPEGNTYTYNSESRRWSRNSDTSDVEESVSLEDVIKRIEQSDFQLPAYRNMIESANQNDPSIMDVVTHMFSSEMDSNAKDELVQRYGFMDVSDFLQKVMSCAKTTSSLENKLSGELNSVENTNGQIEEYSEDEDLHAQCWTGVSLYYVLTKSFFSVICRDEYALLYYLKKYLLSLDTKIADSVRIQSANISNQKSSSSKVNLTSDQKEKAKDVGQKKKTKDVKQSDKLLDGFENNNSDSLSEDSKLSVLKDEDALTENKSYSKNIVLNGGKLESKINIDNEEIKLEGDVNLYQENVKGKLENEVDSVNESKFSDEVPVNLPVESDASGEIASYVKENKSKPFDVIVSNDNAVLDNSVIFSDKNCEEGVETENEFDLQNGKERNLKASKEGSFIEGCTAVNSDRAKDCDSNDCVIETNKIEHGSDSIQDKLQTQYERISEQIKSLQLEEFWYPDPFVSVTDLRTICCDIFHKHPCALIKKKFHELVHEVDEWCAKYSFVEKSEICQICQKISA